MLEKCGWTKSEKERMWMCVCICVMWISLPKKLQLPLLPTAKHTKNCKTHGSEKRIGKKNNGKAIADNINDTTTITTDSIKNKKGGGKHTRKKPSAPF